GVKKASRARKTTAKTTAKSGPRTGGDAFQKGLQALAQYVARTGSVTVPRGHVEALNIDGTEHAVKLGMWLTNTKTRRAKLNQTQLDLLAGLGLDWARQ
ncbi:helicase associated domain-containing protein, partial [Streptomyces sp. NPDC047023]|uniref:helicase associated domain-containing protein n=1 Tax=Streptomyces sp. NPDC047023 TaxID=3155139 RepID=UPI0033FD4E33